MVQKRYFVAYLYKSRDFNPRAISLSEVNIRLTKSANRRNFEEFNRLAGVSRCWKRFRTLRRPCLGNYWCLVSTEEQVPSIWKKKKLG